MNKSLANTCKIFAKLKVVVGIKPAPTEKLCGPWRGTLLAKYFHKRLE